MTTNKQTVSVSLGMSVRIGDEVLVRAYVDGRQIGVLTFRSREWFQLERGNGALYVAKPVDHSRPA